jgi:uncharacterized membrane protein YbhN (UPF0104 family)
MRNKLFLAIKIAISVGIFFALASRIEVAQLVSRLNNADVFYFTASVFSAILAVVLISYRWYLIASGIPGLQISFSTATRATFAGLFVGQVLPGAIGVDIVRGWLAWRPGFNNKQLVASLILDRLISLFALVCMIIAALPILKAYLPEKIFLLVWTSLLGITACVVLGYFVVGQVVQRFLIRLGLKNLMVSRLTTGAALGLAIFAHGLIILSAFFMSCSIGVDSTFWIWFLLMPIIILITAIPISINGWGVREGAMVYLWGLFGITATDAFLTSICIGIVAILASLPGVLFWLKTKETQLVKASI